MGMPFHQQPKQPYLEILVQPQSKFRFRYRSEMTGKHGSLLGSAQSQQQSMMAMMKSVTGGASTSSAYGMMKSETASSSCSAVGPSVSGHVYLHHHVEGSSHFPSSSSSSSLSASQAGMQQGPPSVSSNNGSKLYPTVKVSYLRVME